MPEFTVTTHENPAPAPVPAPESTVPAVAPAGELAALDSLNIADLIAYTPAPPPARGEFLPYLHFHWPVQGMGKPYHLQLVEGGKQNAQWMEWPFIVTTVFARGAAKVVNLASPESTEWAFEQMPNTVNESGARYREMLAGDVPGVEKGTSYMLALWKIGMEKPMIVTFDCFKTLNNATFNALNDVKVSKRKGLHFRTGDLSSVMVESAKTRRWFPDTGKFNAFAQQVPISEEDVSAVKAAMDAVSSKVKGWIVR